MNNERQETNYLDFELRIDQGKGREYPISVINSPVGEATETMHFPYDELVLENRLKSFQIAYSLFISKQDINPIKEPKKSSPLEAPPGAKLPYFVAKPTQTKSVKTLQEQAPPSKPSLEKVTPAAFYKQPKKKRRSIFKRQSLFIIIGIITALAGYLIFKPGAGKRVFTEPGKDAAHVVTEEEKKMPADVQKIKDGGIDVYRNETGCWEADFGNGIIMVYIPAGEFTMGANDGNDDEKPVHRVYLDAYWIAKFEVTFEQYDKYCEETGKEKPGDAGWGRGKRPLINVSWEDATAYCDWLNKKTGSNFKLPTEAQWEKAARGTAGFIYPWGNTFDKNKCNSRQAELKMTAPVSGYPEGKSPYGCFDMAGNVWEWCLDRYDSEYYKKGPERNPPGSEYGSAYAVRGGGWGRGPLGCRCSFRLADFPTSRRYDLGFRLARN